MEGPDTHGSVLGIDPGFSEREPTTCLCLLVWNDKAVRFSWKLTGSNEDERRTSLRRLVPAGTHLQAVAIDGPLTRNLLQILHYRAAEALLSRGTFQKRGKPGQTSSPNGQILHKHATAFAKLVLEMETEGLFSVSPANHFRPIHKKAIVEAFPNQFLGAMMPENKIPVLNRDASDRYWESLAENHLLDALMKVLLPGRTMIPRFRDILGHEHRAGVVCTLTALSVACGQCVAIGDPIDGYICLPPSETWGKAQKRDGSWMEDALRANLLKVKATDRPDLRNHHKAEIIDFEKVWFF